MFGRIPALFIKSETKESAAKRLVPLAVSASPAAFDKFVLAEIRRWEKVVSDNNLRID